MFHHRFPPSQASKQSGVVLFVALILLLILSLLGVTAARMQTVEERMARNDHNREISAQAAEAALRAAEVALCVVPFLIPTKASRCHQARPGSFF